MYNFIISHYRDFVIIMNKKILLIDDSKTQLSTLKIFFKREGFDVVTASDGIEGYQKLFEDPPDVVISDIMMPNLNGYQLCRLVKDNPLVTDIPIILLTILEQKIDKFWSKKSGADMFLLKSNDFEKIVETINHIIEEKPVSEEQKEAIKANSFSGGIIQSEINQILDSSLMKASVLNEFRLLTMHLEDNDVLAQNLFDLLSSVLNYDLALMIFKNPGCEDKEVYASGCLNLEDDTIKKAIYKSLKEIYGDGYSSYNLKTVSENWCGLEKISDRIFEDTYFHKIYSQNRHIATICFFGTADKDIKGQKFFPMVLNEIELLSTLKSLYAQNKFLSVTDSLTGLYNRRQLMDNLEREVERAKRYKTPLSVALLDLDYFKKVNDTYGHQAGDCVLKEVTGTIKHMLRKTDIVFRYGGEEVIILMPETDKYKASLPFERIRKAIEAKEIKFNGNIIKTTISVGIVDTGINAPTTAAFIEYADKAMYMAKERGRNQVVLYDE